MLLTLAGIVLIVIVMVDLIWTTIAIYGGGFVTNPVMKGTDRILHGPHSRLSTVSGPVTVFLVILLWVALLWLGWFLVFSGDPLGLVKSKTDAPADWVERIYFTGFTVSTLGIGDVVPANGRARAITPVAAFSGLLVATLAITYVLSLVGAVVQKRQLAFSISGLGTTPRDLLRKTCNGQSFTGLELPLNSLASELTKSAEQRLAYPILDNFHSREAGGSLVLQVAVLDEALNLLTCGVEKSRQPDAAILQTIRSAVTHYIDRTVKGKGAVTVGVPEVPPLERLADTGSTLKNEQDYNAAMDALADRRQLLHQLIRNEGWQWSDVHAAGSD